MDKLHSEILEHIYEDIESKVCEIVGDISNTSFYSVLQCISLVSSYLEVYRFEGQRLSGKKKHMLCKEFLLQKLINLIDETKKDEFYEIIEYSGEHMIETLIDFAKNNKVLQKTKKCTKKVCCM